jgi:hypothetical protein
MDPESRSGRRGEERILTLPRLELRPFGRPAGSQSLYRLRYLGSCVQLIRKPYLTCAVLFVLNSLTSRLLPGACLREDKSQAKY